MRTFISFKTLFISIFLLAQAQSNELYFFSAAKPSGLGTLCVVPVVVVVVVVVGPLLELTHVQFFRGVFKSCQIFYILSKPKQHFREVCSRVARMFKPTSQVTFPEVRSKRCVQRNYDWK